MNAFKVYYPKLLLILNYCLWMMEVQMDQETFVINMLYKMKGLRFFIKKIEVLQLLGN